MSPSETFPFKVTVRGAAGSSMDSEVRVLDGRDQPVGDGFGGVQLDLPPGLYAVRVERAGVQVEKVLRHAGRTDETIDAPLRFSAVPTIDTATSHEYYQGPAKLFSNQPTAPPLGADTMASLFIFVRAASEDAKRVPLDAVQLRILDYAGAELVPLDPAHTERDDNRGWIAFNAPAAVGEWVLRYDAPAGSASPSRDMAIATFHGWQTQVFMTLSDGLLFGSASVLMSRAGFHADDRMSQAVDSALAGLQNGANTLLPEDRRLLLYGKFDNPMLGLVGAHVLLQEADPDVRTIQTVLGNMEHLLGPDSPDNRALQLLAARRLRLPAPPPEPFERPPIVRAGLEAVLAAAAEDPGLVPPGGVLDRIAAQRFADAPWSTWKPALPADSTRSGDPGWVTQYVAEATRSAARRGEDPDLVALASSAALPLSTVQGAYALTQGGQSLELERLLADSRKQQMDSDEAERLLAEGDDDERVRALGHMQSKPLKKYAEVVTQAVQAPRSEFEHVQSLRVAQQLVPKLDAAQRGELAQAIARPTVQPGSDPWYIGRQVLSDLGD